MSFMWFDDCVFARFSRSFGWHYFSLFSLIFALQRFFGFSERGKATFSVGLYGETKLSGSPLPLGTWDCET